MAKIPEVKFLTYEEMAKNVAEKALDDFCYEGKTIREWMQIIAEQDAISRQAVLDATVKKNSIWNSVTNSKGENLEEIILQLPPVNPQEPKWIPVSERLPEDGTWNLFTDGKNVSVERYKSDAIDHFFPEGRWFSFENVIAWMPLPKPYTESEK